MLTLLSALLGFGSSFVPKIMETVNRHQNHKHELERMRLSAELAKDQHRMDMLHLNTKADIEEAKALHRHDARLGQKAPAWVDSVRAMVRPVLTFGSLFLYGGLLLMGDETMLTSNAFQGLEAMVATVWSFWFGSRALQKR